MNRQYEGMEIVRLTKDHPDHYLRSEDCGVVWGVYGPRSDGSFIYEATFFGTDGDGTDMMFSEDEVQRVEDVTGLPRADRLIETRAALAPWAKGAMRVPLDHDEAKVVSDVRTYGWHVVLIPDDDEGPGFGFSVGLFHSYQHPEIIVFGLSLELTHEVINSLGDDIKAGRSFAAGEEYGGILEAYRCTFLAVDPMWYAAFMGYAEWFYEGGDFPALQCVWPDKEQRFPWEAEFNPAWQHKQPLLVSDEHDLRLTHSHPASERPLELGR